MTETTIRQVQDDEMREILYPLSTYAFRSTPPLPDKEEWMAMVRRRQEITSFALFEGKNPVAIVCSAPMNQNIRGLRLPMSGIWGVITRTEARRKGYSKRLLTRLLEAVQAQGRAISCLYPFRESFYENLGYTTFPMVQKVSFDSPALLPLLKLDLDGKIELSMQGDDFDHYQSYLQHMQTHTHGMALFDFPDSSRAERNNPWQAKAIVDGRLVGLMLYRIKGELVTKFEFEATRFYYNSSKGRYLLLSWIARHIGQADDATLWLAPSETPETWLSDLRVVKTSVARPPMGRIMDVTGINGMACGRGRFTALLTDPICPWNQGVWAFDSVGGKLQVSPAETAGCHLSIQALSGLIYGTHSPSDFELRGWGDPSARTQTVMLEMFPPEKPYLHEHY